MDWIVRRADGSQRRPLIRAIRDLEKGQAKFYWRNSTDKQRFYDAICLIYGHNPDKYNYLHKNGTLPRGELTCARNYASLRKYGKHFCLHTYEKGCYTFEQSTTDAGFSLPELPARRDSILSKLSTLAVQTSFIFVRPTYR